MNGDCVTAICYPVIRSAEVLNEDLHVQRTKPCNDNQIKTRVILDLHGIYTHTEIPPLISKLPTAVIDSDKIMLQLTGFRCNLVAKESPEVRS